MENESTNVIVTISRVLEREKEFAGKKILDSINAPLLDNNALI